MGKVYKITILDVDYIINVLNCFQENDLFIVSLDYKHPTAVKHNGKNLLFHKVNKVSKVLFKVVGVLEPVTEWDESLQKAGVDYRQFYKIENLFFRLKKH